MIVGNDSIAEYLTISEMLPIVQVVPGLVTDMLCRQMAANCEGCLRNAGKRASVQRSDQGFQDEEPEFFIHTGYRTSVFRLELSEVVNVL